MQFNLFSSIYSTNLSNISLLFWLVVLKLRPSPFSSWFSSSSFFLDCLVLGLLLSDPSGSLLPVQFYTNTHNVFLHITLLISQWVSIFYQNQFKLQFLILLAWPHPFYQTNGAFIPIFIYYSNKVITTQFHVKYSQWSWLSGMVVLQKKACLEEKNLWSETMSPRKYAQQ